MRRAAFLPLLAMLLCRWCQKVYFETKELERQALFTFEKIRFISTISKNPFYF